VAAVAGGSVIGVDLGGTKLLAGAITPDGAVHHRTNRLVAGLDQDGLLQMIGDAVQEMRAVAEEEVCAVGFGIPCTFDAQTGMAVQAVNVPLHDVPFAALMAERLALPVSVDNDANCAVLAEARAGVAAGCSDVVLLTLGTGIGSGLLLSGQVYRGARGGGAELGHMVVDADGPRCQGTCPNHGCLEVYASGTALLREVSLAVASRPDTALGRALDEGHELTGPLVTSMAREGDPVAAEAIARIGTSLGVGLASVVNIFDPEVIVIGGGVVAAGELLLEPARVEMRRRALPPGSLATRVEAAAFGPEAGMIGAAIMASEGGGILREGDDTSTPADGRGGPAPMTPA
jgi:glucokinase